MIVISAVVDHNHPSEIAAGASMVARPTLLSPALRLKIDDLRASGQEVEALCLAKSIFSKILGKCKFTV